MIIIAEGLEVQDIIKIKGTVYLPCLTHLCVKIYYIYSIFVPLSEKCKSVTEPAGVLIANIEDMFDGSLNPQSSIMKKQRTRLS